MKMLICDDEQLFVDELKTKIEQFTKQKHIDCEIYTSNDPTVVENDGNVYQIAFLDIKMKPIDGLALAKILKKTEQEGSLVFYNVV